MREESIHRPVSITNLSLYIGLYLLLICLFIVLTPTHAVSQENSSVGHATLKEWVYNVRQNIYHKEGYEGGRFYQHGLFRFFTREMDYEYDMDIATINPTPLAAYHFWSSDNALQTTFGSLNYQRLVIKTKFKSTISLENSSYVELLGIQEENLRSDGFFFQPGYYKELTSSQTLGFQHTLSRYKEDLDVSFIYRLEDSSLGQIDAEISILDWALGPYSYYQQRPRVCYATKI